MTGPSRRELLLACKALADRVRDEYPSDRSLAYIVAGWGCAPPEQVEAVSKLEAYWAREDGQTKA